MPNSARETMGEGDLLIFRSYKAGDRRRVWIDNQYWWTESGKWRVERLTESTLTLQPIIDEQTIIPFNNVACSLCPSIIEPRDGSSSGSSQTLNAILQSPEMLSPSDDLTTPSLALHISVSDDSDTPIYTTQHHFVSSPTSDTRRPHHRLRGYRSDSTESTDKLGSEEISRLTRDHDMSLVTGTWSSQFPSIGLSHDEKTVTVSIYPVAPEYFSRHEKRRRM
jgi:hypothetical protein